MARKIIDIGIVGNDGTGDSIRDSFRKVNDNFRELYASLGLGERLTFINLDDTPSSYVGQNDPDTGAAPVLAINATESGLVFKQIVQGIGINIFHRDNEIEIASAFSEISRDLAPALGGPLNAFSAELRRTIGNLPDVRSPTEFQNAVSSMTSIHGGDTDDPDRIVVNKGYADTKISLAGVDAIDPRNGRVNEAFGRMTGPLILSRDPEDEDDERYGGLIAATKSYVDNAAFGSRVNLYVATSGQDERPGLSRELQGRALPYAYRTLEAALKRAEELVLEARNEIGPYKKILTYGSGANICTLTNITSSPESGSGFAATPVMTVDDISISNVGSNYYSGDILTIAGGTVAPGGGRAKIRVLTTTGSGGTSVGSIVTFRIESTGSYTVLPGSTDIGVFFEDPVNDAGGPETIGAIGQDASFNLTYKVSSVNITNGGSNYSLVSVRITGGGGSGAFGSAVVNPSTGSIVGISVTDSGSGFTSLPTVVANLPRFEIFTNFQRTDFTGDISTDTPAAIAGRDIREGLYLYGEESGALAQILSHTGELDTDGNEWFDVDIKSGSFIVGEPIAYGDVTKNIQISIIVESGVYEENYPLRVPQNVAIVGDEFRRVIVKPRYGTSSSPWAFIKFRRDLSIDGNPTATQLFGYHYLQDSSEPVYPKIPNPGSYRFAATLIDLNRTFLQNEVIAWINYKIQRNEPPFSTTFEYNQTLCKRDVGFIIDAMIFDLKYGGYNRTISAGLKYYQNASGLIAIGSQLSQTLAAVDKLESLILSVIQNVAIDPVYQAFYPQQINRAFVSEVGSSTVIGSLFDAIKDVMDGSGSVNYPKENNQMDVFLCNDAIILRAMTMQGHGGFAMVLDPEGQILAKSPYAQECASFSRSTGRKTFAGGMFSDGFTGNLQFKHSSTISGPGIAPNSRITVSGLERFPQLPASFIVDDNVYRINYVRDYVYNVNGSTATFVLDENTPFDRLPGAQSIDSFTIGPSSVAVINKTNHRLQSGSVIVFSGSLPTGIVAGREYYILQTGLTDNSFRISAAYNSTTAVTISTTGGSSSYQRIYEVLMPGNRSMLANDFTQINDLGYGAVAHNGGLMELVSMFTYYCQISYYSLNGGQIRSVSGSSAHGNYALVAQGADPLEVPTPTSFYTDLSQPARVFAAIAGRGNERGGTQIYVNYTDYFPLPGTELEINHGGSFVRYLVSTVDVDDIATKRVKLNIGTAGGLVAAVPHGQIVTLRNNAYHVLTGDVVNVATRPSTALLLNESDTVYRVLDFIEYDTNYDKEVYTVTGINLSTGVITTVIPHRQQVGYTVRFVKDSGATFPSAIVAGTTFQDSSVYYVVEIVSDTQFKISASLGGAVLDVSAGPGLSGTVTMVPYGLAVTQLRQNYDYADIVVYDKPIVTEALKTVTGVNPATNIISLNSHGFKVGEPLRFSISGPGDLPDGISATSTYFVISENYTANQFSVGARPIVDSTFSGTVAGGVGPTITSIGGTGPFTAQITNITCLEEIRVGAVLVEKSTITGVSADGDGSICTLTFTRQAFPPFNQLQEIIISGFTAGAAGFNGTQTVIECTETTVTFSSGTVATGTGGSIDASYSGSLGTNTRITLVSKSTGTISIISDTIPSAGTIVFNSEPPIVDITSTGSGTIRVGKAAGEPGDTEFAVSDLGPVDTERIARGISIGENYKFVYEGTEYEVVGYTPVSTGVPYGVLEVNPPLERSVLRSPNSLSLKAGVPGQSSLASGNLQVRISLTRVTSHDLLEIGTGSYSDTNYPNEIYGPPRNPIIDVPSFAVSEDEDGAEVLRAEMQERGSGRVFYVTTDQFGNFNVGPFFRVDQGTGTVTFSASIALSQLDGLGFKRGRTISEFSDSMDAGRVDSVPTEAAIRTYINKRLGQDQGGNVVDEADRVPTGGGFLALNGVLPMTGNLDLANFRARRVGNPSEPTDAVNLQSLTFSNFQEVEFNSPASGDFAVLTGAGSNIINASMIGDVTGSITYNITTTLVGAYIDDSTIEVDSGIEDESQVQVNDGIVVANISSFPNSGFFKINNEIFAYTGRNVGANRFTGVSRAALGSTGSAHAAGSTVQSLSAVDFTTNISSGVITNNEISSSAAIDQAKLDLNFGYATTANTITNVSATRSGSTATFTFAALGAAPFVAGSKFVVSGFTSTDYNGTWTALASTTTQVTATVPITLPVSAVGTGTITTIRGISNFSNSNFTVSDGLVSLKANGVGFNNLEQVDAKSALGNNGLSAANPTAVPFTTIVDQGLAIKKSQYGALTGFLRHTVTSVSTQDSPDFAVVDSAAGSALNPEGGKLIQRTADGDFGARIADLSQLKIDNNLALDSTTFSTGGGIRLYGWNSRAGVLIQTGTIAQDNKTIHYNDLHQFLTQDGSFGAPITASSIEVTTLTAGGNLSQGFITGRWTLTGTSPNESRLQATYSADLAEYYEGDKEYEVGTVLVFGGDKEVTTTNVRGDTRVAGVVSNTAAFVMYDACPGHKNLVALQGRVPCRVVGKIKKGDLLITSAIAGVAEAARGDVKVGTVVGKALTNYDSDHIGTIEIAVGRT